MLPTNLHERAQERIPMGTHVRVESSTVESGPRREIPARFGVMLHAENRQFDVLQGVMDHVTSGGHRPELPGSPGHHLPMADEDRASPGLEETRPPPRACLGDAEELSPIGVKKRDLTARKMRDQLVPEADSEDRDDGPSREERPQPVGELKKP